MTDTAAYLDDCAETRSIIIEAVRESNFINSILRPVFKCIDWDTLYAKMIYCVEIFHDESLIYYAFARSVAKFLYVLISA